MFSLLLLALKIFFALRHSRAYSTLNSVLIFCILNSAAVRLAEGGKETLFSSIVCTRLGLERKGQFWAEVRGIQGGYGTEYVWDSCGSQRLPVGVDKDEINHGYERGALCVDKTLWFW